MVAEGMGSTEITQGMCTEGMVQEGTLEDSNI